MKQPNRIFFGRERELLALTRFCAKPGPGFTYVRGRRRVGKSWILKRLQKQTSHSFYFPGAQDESDEKTRLRFIKAWGKFNNDSLMAQFSGAAPGWDVIFSEINKLASIRKSELVLIFDEIQWLAKQQSGFVGLLKAAWVDWEALASIKVIICGSSNKFFHDLTGGEEKILRGIKTHANIQINPFTPSEVYKYFLRDWSLEENCLTYMMLGGIPYYLWTLQPELGFIHAINRAVFLQSSIFLEEVDELLSLDFNSQGVETVKQILSCLGQDGTTQSQIITKSGLAQSTVSDALEKLIDFNIVHRKYPANASPNPRNHRFFMKDFYLNFYFQVLEQLSTKIHRNVRGLLFPAQCLSSKVGYYIPNFSGKAFELLLRYSLENCMEENLGIFSKLLIADQGYEILDYWDNSSQIDLLIESKEDRLSRLVECKWISENKSLSPTDIAQVANTTYTPPNGYSKKLYLLTSKELGPKQRSYANKHGITNIDLNDLFHWL